MRAHIFQPIKIGNVTVPNRIVRLASGFTLANDDQTVSDNELDYFETLAKSGTGLIVYGALRIDNDWACYLENEDAIYDDKFLPGLTEAVKRIHKYDSKVFFQLWHPGYVAYTLEDGKRFCDIAELSLDEIDGMVEKFRAAAVRAKKAGADGVEVQLCHTYLLNQFLSPHFNHRTDEYSAEPLENGMRLAMRVFDAIHEACGKDFPIIVKVQGTDFFEDGITVERMIQCLPYLEKAGIALISVSAGGERSGNPNGMAADGHSEEGWKVLLAEAIKKATTIPVCATGSIRHPDYVEQILAEGKCDMVGMARGLMAEPEWVAKVAEGREAELRYCVSCMRCLDTTDMVNPPCTVNPTAKCGSAMRPLKINGNGRAVAVIGAGPGGMEAAITLAKRGFKPVVFERSGEIGGSLNLACKPDGAYKLHWLVDYHQRMAETLGVEIRLNTNVTANELLAMHPYAVVVATGSDGFTPPIPGFDLPMVKDVRDILRTMPYISGKKIVVIGAGMTGVETATTYAARGNDVSIVDMMEMPDPMTIPWHDALHFGYAEDAGVQMFMGHKLLKVEDGCVVAESLDTNQTVTIKADLVFNAMGVRSNRGLAEELKEAPFQVICIGDAIKPGRAVTAVSDGYQAALKL